MNRLLLVLLSLALCLHTRAQQQNQAPQDTVPPAPFRAEWPFKDSADFHAPNGKFIDDFRLFNTGRTTVLIHQMEAVDFHSKTERFPSPVQFSLGDKAQLPFTLKPGASVSVQANVEISKTDTIPGRYKITWSQEKGAPQHDFFIPRRWIISPPAVPNPTFFNIEPISASRWDCNALPITITIRDTSKKGEGGLIRHPSFLIRENEDNALYETRKTVMFSWLKDGKAHPWPEDSLLMVPAKGSLTLQMDIQGLQPGKGYDGELLFAAENGKEVGSKFTIYYRRSVGIAFMVIFLGVVMAAALRWLLDQQERLRQRRRLEDLKNEVKGMVPPVETGQLEAPHEIQAILVDNIQKAIRNCKMAQMKEEDFATTVESIEEWMKLFRDWLGLRKKIAEMADLQDNETIQTAMKAVEDFLRDPQGDTADAKAKLNEVRAEMNKVALAKLKEVAEEGEVTRSGDLHIKGMLGNQWAKWFKSGNTMETMEPQEENPVVIRRTLARNLFLVEVASNAITLVVASVAGLLLLWWKDNTWGSLEDILTAFFWGFGVNSLLKEGDFKRGTAGFLANKIRGKGDE